MEKIHACYRTDDYYDGELWKCEVCDFTGYFEDVIAHVVDNQFVVQ